MAGAGGGFAGAVEDVESEVAAAFGPFVVLFGQDGADEAGDGVAVGEDSDDVGAAADFFVQAFVGVDAPMDCQAVAGVGWVRSAFVRWRWISRAM